jgi:hypothetical protein
VPVGSAAENRSKSRKAEKERLMRFKRKWKVFLDA